MQQFDSGIQDRSDLKNRNRILPEILPAEGNKLPDRLYLPASDRGTQIDGARDGEDQSADHDVRIGDAKCHRGGQRGDADIFGHGIYEVHVVVGGHQDGRLDFSQLAAVIKKAAQHIVKGACDNGLMCKSLKGKRLLRVCKRMADMHGGKHMILTQRIIADAGFVKGFDQDGKLQLSGKQPALADGAAPFLDIRGYVWKGFLPGDQKIIFESMGNAAGKADPKL